MVKKASNLVFLLLLAAVFVSVPILTVLGHGKISYYEQRMLAPFPALSWESVMDGSYFSALEAFLSDHFGGRDQLLKADTALRMKLGKPVVNDLVVNTDPLLNYHGYLHWGTDYMAASAAVRAEAYQSLQEYAASFGGTFCFLALPYQATYFAGDYPSYLDDRLWNTNAMRDCLREAMTAAGVPYIDMYEEYRREDFPREYYFESDHH